MSEHLFASQIVEDQAPMLRSIYQESLHNNIIVPRSPFEPLSLPRQDLDTTDSIKLGWSLSLIGNAMRFRKFHSNDGFEPDPSYSVSNDPAVKANPAFLPYVVSSQSAAETAWIIRQFNETSQMNEQTPQAGFVGMAIGSIAGDPTSYMLGPGIVPAMTGLKAITAGTLGIKRAAQISLIPSSVAGRAAASAATFGTLSYIQELTRQGMTFTQDDEQLLNATLLPMALGGVFGAISKIEIVEGTPRMSRGGLFKEEIRKESNPYKDPSSQSAPLIDPDALKKDPTPGVVDPNLVTPDTPAAKGTPGTPSVVPSDVVSTGALPSSEASLGTPGLIDPALVKSDELPPPFAPSPSDGPIDPSLLKKTEVPSGPKPEPSDGPIDPNAVSSVGAKQVGPPGTGPNPNAAAPTGTLIEHLPINPTTRILKAVVSAPIDILHKLVSVPLFTNANVEGIASDAINVPFLFRSNHLSPLYKTSERVMEIWGEMRGLSVGKGPIRDNIAIGWQAVKDGVTTTFGSDAMTLREFRERISLAIRYGDPGNDAASPFVRNAANEVKSLIELTTVHAARVDLFRKTLRAQADGIMAEIRELAGPEAVSRASYNQASLFAMSHGSDRVRQLGARLLKIDKEIQDISLNSGKPTVKTAVGYVPRIYLRSKIKNNYDTFVDEVSRFVSVEKQIPIDDARNMVHAFAEEILNAGPSRYAYDRDGNFIEGGFAKMRSFDVSDKALQNWIEQDIDQILRVWTKQMGMDIELTRAFGDPEMVGAISDMRKVYDEMIADERVAARTNPDPDFAKKIEALAKERDAMTRDIEALRDMHRGTFGASVNPDSLTDRVIRQIRNAVILTTLEGAAITNLVDLGRAVMVDGLTSTLKYAWLPYVRGTGKVVRQSALEELRYAGWAFETVAQSHAFSLADTGDVFSAKTMFERGMNSAANGFFYISGMNYSTQFMMQVNGMAAMGKLNEMIVQMANGTLGDGKIARMSNLGINAADAREMLELFIQQGYNPADGFTKPILPNTPAWTFMSTAADLARTRELVQRYRAALDKFMLSHVPMPQVGDRANWTSTPLGSLLTMYRGFSQAAVMRGLMPGLQEHGYAFFVRASALVAAGIMATIIKDRLAGRETNDDFGSLLMAGIDRSGVLGWFADVNNATERLSRNGIGVRPFGHLLGLMDAPAGGPASQVFGAVGGPVAGQVVRTAEIAGRWAQGKPTPVHAITPLADLPQVQGIERIIDLVQGEDDELQKKKKRQNPIEVRK